MNAEHKEMEVVSLLFGSDDEEEVVDEFCVLDCTFKSKATYQFGLFYVINLYIFVESSLEGISVLVKGKDVTQIR